MEYLETAKEVLANGWHLGIRATSPDEQYEVEDECRESYEWDLENDCSTFFTTKETAGGTCCIGIDTEAETAEELAELIEKVVTSFKRARESGRGYGDKKSQVILIAGWERNNDYQMDDGEIRIRGAWVQEIC